MRPEYLNAIQAAAWNHWMMTALIAPAILIGMGIWLTNWRKTLFAAAFLAGYCFFSAGVQYYWDAKLQFAVTAEERQDATSDTGALFGPVIVGLPAMLVYCLVLVSIRTASQRAFGRNRSQIENSTDTGSVGNEVR